MTFVFQVVHRVTSLQEKGGFYWTSQRNLTMSCLNRLHPTDWFWGRRNYAVWWGCLYLQPLQKVNYPRGVTY